MDARFIRVHNKFVRVDSIGYVDFLDSGRSMIFIPGLNQEKQNITVDEHETRRLREALEPLAAEPKGGTPDGSDHRSFDRRPDFSRSRSGY